jgi:hypothetical protein
MTGSARSETIRAHCSWVDRSIVAELDERGDAVSDRIYIARFDGVAICSGPSATSRSRAAQGYNGGVNPNAIC